jgi:hypothetical protein
LKKAKINQTVMLNSFQHLIEINKLVDPETTHETSSGHGSG